MNDEIKPGYTRISEILSHLKNFSHIDPVVLQNKANIGTEVHKAIEMDFNGEFPYTEGRVMNYYTSFLQWQETFNPTCVKKEERLYCDKLKITGQLDAIVTFPGDHVKFLIDFKTSAQEDPLTWPLQAHFYYYLYTETYGKGIANRFIFLKLDKDGNLPRAYSYFYSENTMNRCFQELRIFRQKSA